MNDLLVFAWVLGGFVCWSFWEAYIEGNHPWGGNQVGWKHVLTRHFTLTAYHFWLNMMLFFFLSLPFIITGWSTRLFGLILSAAMVGFMVEDRLWFVINPKWKKKWNAKNVTWYPWFTLGGFEIPKLYVFAAIVAVASWWFLWA